MSNVKKIPFTRKIIDIVRHNRGLVHPTALFPILFDYSNSNVSREVFDDFLARIIILCAMYNNLEVLQYIILWGGDPDVPVSEITGTSDNRTALNIARERGSESVVNYLLTRPAVQLDRKRYLEDLPLPIEPGDIKLLPGSRANPDFLSEGNSAEFMDEKNAAQHTYYNGLGGKRRRSRRRTMRKKKTRRYRR